MNAESGSRALGAANDLLDLLRLAQAAAERVAQEVYGPSFEHADLLTRELQRLRRSAEKLAGGVEDIVSRNEPAPADRPHPRRRASDHH